MRRVLGGSQPTPKMGFHLPFLFWTYVDDATADPHMLSLSLSPSLSLLLEIALAQQDPGGSTVAVVAALSSLPSWRRSGRSFLR